MKITKATIVFTLMYAAMVTDIVARPSGTALQKGQATVLGAMAPKEFSDWRELLERGTEASRTPFPTDQENQDTMW